MRIQFAVASLFIAASAVVIAQTEISPAALLGKWSVSAQHPNGAAITTVVQLTQNMRFITSTTVNGKPFMEASGTWKLSGRQLEWRYEQSSHPAINKGHTDLDEVQAVSATELVLTSSLSGKTHTYKRVQL